ncbi:hypothetical protein CH373_13240 [Leptospira perolatii]|uniref:Late embryogenesis abundant protein LEA-2 subgroup domain-containing protein n=1 Tax=Leptospira perolatii TaxID=2023191 RepID=A0A2M9ZKS2_9LEPT|nr:LEA type 2 family protein [Leptospira perolatii]PJZ69926.1 hypothetical protein CH360_08445 [Leptospira perolatii]PJZ72666.1 hypothetical protein CH373_13240 [Leptospira perolatii]
MKGDQISENSTRISTYALSFLMSLLILLTGNSCGEVRENLKKLQTCKFKVLQVRTERVEFISFPPIPKIKMVADLEIENPNESDVTLNKFDLSLLVQSQDGKESELAMVTTDQETILPAGSKKIVELNVETRFEKRVNQELLLVTAMLARDILSGKNPVLRVSGSISYKTFLGEVDLPVNETVKLQGKQSQVQGG